MTKTTIIKKKDIKRNWYLIDARGVRLGKLASKAASILGGKEKSTFSPSLDTGDFVVVVNSKELDFYPKRLGRKIYWTHSGYPGALSKKTLAEMIEKDSNEVVKKAIWGMIPKTKLGRKMIKRLHVYRDERHKHEAQKPKKVEIK